MRFELTTSDLEGLRSANWATTALLNYLVYAHIITAQIWFVNQFFKIYEIKFRLASSAFKAANTG